MPFLANTAQGYKLEPFIIELDGISSQWLEYQVGEGVMQSYSLVIPVWDAYRSLPQALKPYLNKTSTAYWILATQRVSLQLMSRMCGGLCSC